EAVGAEDGGDEVGPAVGGAGQKGAGQVRLADAGGPVQEQRRQRRRRGASRRGVGGPPRRRHGGAGLRAPRPRPARRPTARPPASGGGSFRLYSTGFRPPEQAQSARRKALCDKGMRAMMTGGGAELMFTGTRATKMPHSRESRAL